jgi:hypothetical protein
MRADINTLADHELGRPHLVEEDKRANHLPHPGRQGTANLEAAKIAGARHIYCFDRVGHLHVARRRIGTRLPTHVAFSFKPWKHSRCSTVEVAGVHL